MDIVGLGTPVMDQLVNLPYMPEKEGAVTINEVFNQGGGKVASALAAAARLGAKTGMLARIGGDFTGDYILKDFGYNGVDVSKILRDSPETSSSYSIAISEEKMGTRVFLGRKATVQRLTAEDLDYDYIASARCLHLENGDEASAKAARFAKENGVIVSIDADQYSSSIEELLPYIDIFIGSEFYLRERYGEAVGEHLSNEAQHADCRTLEMNETAGADENPAHTDRAAYYRESCEDIRRRGPYVVWFTLGDKGCVGLVDGEYYEVPCFSVKVRDTTGAGDVFHGAYLAAMLEGQPHRDCAVFAGAVAAIKCMYVGGRTSIPSRQTLDRFLRDGVVDTAEFEERLRYYRTNF